MNWLEALYQTFIANESSVGDHGDRIPLAPVAHTVQNTQIEITLDRNGNFLSAEVSPLVTIIPCTESSAGRTNAPVAHPLSDKLKYVASDYFSLTGEKRPKKPKTGEAKNHFNEYFSALKNWATSSYGDPKLDSILSYLTNNEGKLLEDLCEAGVYRLDENGRIPKKWGKKEGEAPPIYEHTKNSPSAWDAFVRWRVTIPKIMEDRTYFDAELWRKWEKHYLDSPSNTGICYVTGKDVRLAASHPKRIRSVADGAKLISSNDSSGFTFKGRFTDNEGLQTCSISFDVTQKAHNALRWLIARQGKSFGDQAIVAWALTGKDIPNALVSTADLFEEDEFLSSDLNLEHNPLASPDTGQGIALSLKSKISGYRADLGDTASIVVLSLDSATPGRMAISYYRELSSSEFLDRIEKWHTETAWKQNFNKGKKFVGAPSPLDIAQCAYGTRLDDKLKAATYRRLLPCIIENRPIPDDLVTICIHRATARQSLDHWEWEKALGISCALYRKQQIQSNKHHHTMSLERERTTRSYLYGRLLAVADVLEQTALRSAGENRDTNAARLMQHFARHPYGTWQNIYLSLDPYRRRLKSSAPGLLHIYLTEMDDIKNLFKTAEFCDDSKLEGEFILAFHCQRTSLFTKKEKEPIEQ